MCYDTDACRRRRLDPALAAEVEVLLNDLITQGISFTAYEVTAALRRANPGCAIPHRGGVREEVHSQMAALVVAGYYTCRPAAFYHGTALRYAPVIAAQRRGAVRPLDAFGPGLN
jgi:hypothetical protein